MRILYETPISGLGLTTQAPKALAEAGITTVGQLLDYKRDTIAELRGMGASRIADIERALAEHGLSFGKPLVNLGEYATCKTCPACPECGMPRATEAKQVVVDYRGRYRHTTAPGDPCDDCNQHHRELVAAAAVAA